MKRLIVVMLLIVALALSGCGFAKKQNVVKEDVVTMKMGDSRSLRNILDEILANGSLVDKDIYGRNFGAYEYTYELWVIREGTGDYHVAIIENGKLMDIAPCEGLEDTRAKFKPYGGWRK